MTLPDATSSAAAPATSWRDSLAMYLQPRVLIVLFLGFSSGLPLALSGSTLRFWLRESQIDLETIGLFALVGTPYTIKFLWAPLVDALSVPLLSKILGRRRGWLVVSQIMLVLAILLLGFCNPASTPWYVPFGAALLVATASATQDIVVDAFRIESLPKDEQAAGMASYVAAYRISTLVSTAGALFLIDAFEKSGFGRADAWKLGYAAMAALILIGMVTAFVAAEPDQSQLATAKNVGDPMKRVFETTKSALLDFLSLDMVAAVLLFVILFKFTDAFSGIMTEAFVVDIGFSKTDYAAIVKGVGLAATLVGGFAGGFVARRYSLAKSLWIGGVLQAVANLSFSWLALIGTSQWALAFAITCENFTSAIGTVIFVAYLSALCRNPMHTATQYALLTALAAVGRTYLSSVSGYVAKASGWPMFFVICVLVAIPSLVLLTWLQKRGHFEALGSVRV
ncbi:AmpG family muropeptide MFS transporter [Bradyrhizobium amphicarpaeae]|uniref:MFS transporter n=1 Tax=Bradyrhizobium amphicarpaeae TaxID=1404768 RepID=A0A2U8Q130_9BRAD|nr:MFS transporter [Bradyrhizobium amphicarpaeae]AWM03760.1 MFS transporter [Bradyrhizobium amphicarpaeae]